MLKFKRLTTFARSFSRSYCNFRMPAFTLYTAFGSTNSDRVRLTLAEGGFTDYDHVLINLYKGEQKSEEHLKRNPWGKVPAMTTAEGFTLYESRAICKYLAKKYSFPLLPNESDIEAVALFDQAQCEETIYFAEPAGKITYEIFVKKLLGMAPNDALVAESVKSLETFLDVAERSLQQRQYMAGNDFSLVDIGYIPVVQRLFVCGYGNLITEREAVSAWWDRCINRPAIKNLLDADKAAMAAAQTAARK